jgi:hypothetical protein
VFDLREKACGEKAWSLWNEFLNTDDNRDAISGQLRLAADHLMYDHRTPPSWPATSRS